MKATLCIIVLAFLVGAIFVATVNPSGVAWEYDGVTHHVRLGAVK